MEPDYLTAVSDGTADPGPWGAHDPTVVDGGEGRWLMFSTDTAVAGAPGVGVQIRQSRDLVEWTWLGHAFTGVPREAADWSGATGIWAPEVVRRGDEYRMYYSASSFGSRTSAISFATAPSAAGPWEHRAVVVRTQHERDVVNAIDAAVVVDAEGADWLLYGSFFGGLRILPLRPDGLPAQAGDLGTPVVRRAASIHGAVEGGHALWDADSATYALFCSFDSLFDTYSVRVARAGAVAGPYVDHAGRPLVDDREPPTENGLMIVAGYEAPDGRLWQAPGHSSHLVTDSGRFLVHHVRDGAEPTRHTAHLRRLLWTQTGWPLASPLPYAGPAIGDTPDLAGDWLVYRLEPGPDLIRRPSRQTLAAGQLDALALHGRGRVTVDGSDLDAVLFVESDGVAFAGIDERSVVVWGIRA